MYNHLKIQAMCMLSMCDCIMFSDWTGNEEDKADENVWEDNWDDDNVEDDFSQQLR